MNRPNQKHPPFIVLPTSNVQSPSRVPFVSRDMQDVDHPGDELQHLTAGKHGSSPRPYVLLQSLWLDPGTTAGTSAGRAAAKGRDPCPPRSLADQERHRSAGSVRMTDRAWVGRKTSADGCCRMLQDPPISL